MTDEYLITYAGSKQAGYVPVVGGPEIGRSLLYLADKDGNRIRHDDPYKAEAHAGHYLCGVLNESRRTIWVLHVSHRHGDNYAAFTTLEAAQNYLHGYVTDWWDDGLTEQYGALDSLPRDEAIDAYFEAHGEALDPEYYALQEVVLNVPFT